MNICIICNTELVAKQTIVCSNDCKSEYQRQAPRKQIDNTISFKCKLTGKLFKQSAKLSGALSKYSKNVLGKLYDESDWELIDTPIIQTEKWNCPLCDWSTVDINNNSGWIGAHLKKTHSLEIHEFCDQFPQYKELWTMYWIRRDRKIELLNEDSKITCEICGEGLKKITNTHLQKHGITTDQYREQFGTQKLSSITTRKKLQKLYHNNEKLLDATFTSNGQGEINDYIKSLGFETRIRRKNFVELDIFIESKSIAIEYNGLYWHSELHSGKSNTYHLDKTEYCEKNGIHLIHVFEDEWRDSQELIKSRLNNILGINQNKIFARKCEIKVVTNKEKSKFLNDNHLQGNDNSSIRIGLYHENKLVSIMTFRKPLVSMGHKNTSNNTIELSRFCSELNTNVIGGANKLFKYFTSNYPEYSNIITYADRRWTSTNSNTLYDTLGFARIGISKPNYWYMKRHKERLSRFNYTKHKILANFPTADPNLSEWENMRKLNFDRIWDCGTIKYKFEK